MDYRIANDLESTQAELLRSRLGHLDLAEAVAETSAKAAEQASVDRLLNNLKYLDLAVRSEEALKDAYKALGNAEERISVEKPNSASSFAKAHVRQSGPAFFTMAKPAAVAEDTPSPTPAAPTAS